MTFFGLHQREMSKLWSKIFGNFSNGKGSKEWNNIDLDLCFQWVHARTTKVGKPKIMIHLEHMRNHYSLSTWISWTLNYNSLYSTTLLLVSKIVNISCAWPINLQILWSLVLILQIIIHSWNIMRFKHNIGTTFKLQLYYESSSYFKHEKGLDSCTTLKNLDFQWTLDLCTCSNHGLV